ncbi:YraN family protein [Ostreiculturibacter nitratireducens]|uniref:YraN family protein n=1 Tax=Ostreiculturibacter nitratireducens TaxID=3075226 RepID=UPI0031B5D680
MTGEVGYRAGLAAEDQVAARYERIGCAIAARRWRGSGGEIDIVVRDGDSIVFVEVKKSRTFAGAAERLSRRQMERICATASEFIAREPRGQATEVRFDVALVDAAGRIDIVENAFGQF